MKGKYAKIQQKMPSRHSSCALAAVWRAFTEKYAKLQQKMPSRHRNLYKNIESIKVATPPDPDPGPGVRVQGGGQDLGLHVVPLMIVRHAEPGRGNAIMLCAIGLPVARTQACTRRRSAHLIR